MAKTFFSPYEYFRTTPERLSAVIVTHHDGVQFIEFYDKDDENNYLLTLPILFGTHELKNGLINPSYLFIVMLDNGRYAVVVNEHYLKFENNTKVILDEYIKEYKTAAKDLDNINVECNDDWVDVLSSLNVLARYVDDYNPTKYHVKVILSKIIKLTNTLADIINNK